MAHQLNLLMDTINLTITTRTRIRATAKTDGPGRALAIARLGLTHEQVVMTMTISMINQNHVTTTIHMCYYLTRQSLLVLILKL